MSTAIPRPGATPLVGVTEDRINPPSHQQNYEPFTELKVDRPRAGLLRITFDGPGLNAVSPVGHRELADIWTVIARDDSVRVVLLQGAGKGFSSGGSFDLLKSIIDDVEVRERVMIEARDLVFGLINVPQPVVSAIHGPAVGAGLAAALLADISIAATDAKIIDGHVRLGVAAGDRAALVWPLLCGLAKAKYYLLTCEPLTGETAERIGLVSKCVPTDQVESEAMRVCETLLTGAPGALAATKRSLNAWYFDHASIFESSLAAEFLQFGGREVHEGLAAHVEKRPPRFR